jgi:anti-sigma regulatory factor (Ser/Thr protein kinase)
MSHKLNLSCCTSALVELRTFLQGSLKAYGFSEVDRHQVTLAVEEVCANLIIHSHAGARANAGDWRKAKRWNWDFIGQKNYG